MLRQHGNSLGYPIVGTVSGKRNITNHFDLTFKDNHNHHDYSLTTTTHFLHFLNGRRFHL